MAAFWDGGGALWPSGALSGKVGSAFSSSATQHGGQETTLFNLITNMVHFDMIIVGLRSDWAGQLREDKITGGSTYGITTVTGRSRAIRKNELDGARFQGKRVAEIAAKLTK